MIIYYNAHDFYFCPRHLPDVRPIAFSTQVSQSEVLLSHLRERNSKGIRKISSPRNHVLKHILNKLGTIEHFELPDLHPIKKKGAHLLGPSKVQVSQSLFTIEKPAGYASVEKPACEAMPGWTMIHLVYSKVNNGFKRYAYSNQN